MACEFGWMDWDLQAVVRGCNYESPCEAMDYSGQPSFITQQDDDILQNFSDLLETSRVVDDLEELYKPFYPQVTPIASSPVVETIDSPANPEEQRNEHLEKVGNEGRPVAEPVNDGSIQQAASKFRRRKNLHNKVVQHVKADDVSSDVWAWRKYGQKPIKGSPYPRSYYRCSSSKGCSARKQVERSNSDPDIFIVTYTGEHCHSHPTRRNALAGSTRTKFSKPNKSSRTNNETKTKDDHARASCECDDSPSSSSSITLSSPSTAPQGLVTNDEISNLGQTTTRMNDGIMGLEQQIMWDDFSSTIFGDDLFMGFEEMNGMMGLDLSVTDYVFDGREDFDKYGGY